MHGYKWPINRTHTRIPCPGEAASTGTAEVHELKWGEPTLPASIQAFLRKEEGGGTPRADVILLASGVVCRLRLPYVCKRAHKNGR